MILLTGDRNNEAFPRFGFDQKTHPEGEAKAIAITVEAVACTRDTLGRACSENWRDNPNSCPPNCHGYKRQFASDSRTTRIVTHQASVVRDERAELQKLFVRVAVNDGRILHAG